MSATIASIPDSKGATIAAWIIQGLLALAFLAAAGAKLAGVPMLVDVFTKIGIGQWFRYVTAAVEIAGVIGLLVPGYAALAAIWLGVTMFFATLAHVFILHTPPGGALILLTLNVVLVLLRRRQLAAIFAK